MSQTNERAFETNVKDTLCSRHSGVGGNRLGQGRVRTLHIASGIIPEILRVSRRQESETSWFHAQASIGYAQLEAGESIPVTSKNAFAALVRGEK